MAPVTGAPGAEPVRVPGGARRGDRSLSLARPTLRPMVPLASTPRVVDLLLPALVGVLLLVVGVLVGIRLARWVLRHRVARTRRTGSKGQARALRLLAAGGWRVLEREVTAEGVVRVDGEDRAYRVRADALVRRRGRTCVAEFKGGRDSATCLLYTSPSPRDHG